MSQVSQSLRVSCPVLLLLAFLLFELTLIGTSSAQRRRAGSKSRVAEPVADLFRNNCARCHGADGHGDTALGRTYNAPDFTEDEWWRKHAHIAGTRSLVFIVTHGKGGMPAFGKKLKRAQINSLLSYVRRFRKSQGAISAP